MESGAEITSTEFWRFAQIANAENLDYLVIGGLALNFHKILRNTIDSDIWVKPNTANFLKLKSILEKLGYEKDELQFLNELSINQPFVFGIEGPIEFLTHVHYQFDFNDCQARATHFSIDSASIPVISLIDLRELKIRAGRSQDLRDVILIDEFLAKTK